MSDDDETKDKESKDKDVNITPVYYGGLTDPYEFFTKEFASYLIVAVAALIIIVYVIQNVMADFIVFSRDIRFPGEQAFIIGTLFSFLVITYVVYHSQKRCFSNAVLGAFALFLLFFTLFCVNIALVAEYHVKGAAARTNAGFYAVLALICALVIFYYSAFTIGGASALMLVPILWLLYVIYRWWFRFRYQQFFKFDTFGT